MGTKPLSIRVKKKKITLSKIFNLTTTYKIRDLSYMQDFYKTNILLYKFVSSIYISL